MSTQREVVVTGIGVVSPIGIGRAAFTESLCAGRSGIRTLPWLRDALFPVHFGADIADFDGKQYVTPRKSLKVMCREIQFGFSAASLAIKDAGLNTAEVDHDRFGVVFGSELMYSVPEEVIDAYRSCTVDGEFKFELWGEKALSNLFPLWMLKYLPNMPACHIAIAHDARGPNNTLTLGDASSLSALMEASRYIQRGVADVMVVGGTGSQLNITSILFRGHGELSHGNAAPESACRPFDARRDGSVNGEGSGAFVIEDSQHAAARGAKVLARVIGFGATFEAVESRREKSSRSISLAINKALQEAGITPADVGHVNAGSSGSVNDDPIEAAGIREALGDVAVTAPKSRFGSLGAGTGAVEMAATVVGFQERTIFPTMNYSSPDANCPVNVVHGQAQPCDKQIAVALNQASTGPTIAVVLAGD